jgi:hypothetical protein
MGNISYSIFFVFFLLWIVLNIRYFFPMGSKGTYTNMIVSKKMETEIRNWQFFHFHLWVHF